MQTIIDIIFIMSKDVLIVRHILTAHLLPGCCITALVLLGFVGMVFSRVWQSSVKYPRNFYKLILTEKVTELAI